MDLRILCVISLYINEKKLCFKILFHTVEFMVQRRIVRLRKRVVDYCETAVFVIYSNEFYRTVTFDIVIPK